MDTGLFKHRYRVLRKQLDDLGYYMPLIVDSVPLVERLLSDLLHTTESLRNYKDIAQKSLEVSYNVKYKGYLKSSWKCNSVLV